MAEFCKQCATKNGRGLGNFFMANDERIPDNVSDLKKFPGFRVLCDGCGLTYVDMLGQCVNSVCFQNHHDTVPVWRKDVAQLVRRVEMHAYETGYSHGKHDGTREEANAAHWAAVQKKNLGG